MASTIAGMTSDRVQVGANGVGAGAPCFVIAEAGVNHNGDLELALRLVEAAAAAGVDAVKFQTFRAEAVAAAEAPKAGYQLETTARDEAQVDMLKRLELDPDAFGTLKDAAEAHGLVFLSTPFDVGSVELLDGLGVDAFKVASPDLTNHPLLSEIGRRARPVFVSTGIATLDEVGDGVDALHAAGAGGVVVLHCVSEYPAAASDANLRAMDTIARRVGCPVGFSDHTEGFEVALAAVALGACVLEKHLTLDRSLPGPDQRASLEPGELGQLVAAVRRVESALGTGVKEPTQAELRNAPVVRRSLAAADDLPEGIVLTRRMLTALRPGTGIPPARIDEVVGRRLTRSLAHRELLRPDDLE
jgi:N-acetylneuraminate synthase